MLTIKELVRSYDDYKEVEATGDNKLTRIYRDKYHGTQTAYIKSLGGFINTGNERSYPVVHSAVLSSIIGSLTSNNPGHYVSVRYRIDDDTECRLIFRLKGTYLSVTSLGDDTCTGCDLKKRYGDEWNYPVSIDDAVQSLASTLVQYEGILYNATAKVKVVTSNKLKLGSNYITID